MDLVAAWSVFGRALIVPYDAAANPAFAAEGARIVGEVVGDAG
jgi:hypothetical protein